MPSKVSTTQFLNVDLEVCSKTDLQPLADALDKRVFELFVGRVKRTYYAYFELAKHTTTADATIRQFCKLIRALSRADRKVWNAATRRDFSIGIQAGPQPNAADFAVEVETLRAAADLGARIVVTVYGPEKDAA